MPRKGHTEEHLHASGRRKAKTSRGKLPEVGDQRTDLLHLGTKVFRYRPSELRELRQLRDENGKLEKLVADLSLHRLCCRRSSERSS